MVRQGAGVAGEIAPQHEAQGLYPGSAFQLAAQPPGLVGGVGHFPLPEGVQVFFQLFFRQSVGEAGAGAATVEAEHQARRLRGTTMDQRPQVEPPVIAVDAGAAGFHRGAFRSPDQRAIGEQPDLAAFVAGHGVFQGGEQFRAGEVRRLFE
ncbi:hypothetical protein FQZ97_736310 [compost metagenome]